MSFKIKGIDKFYIKSEDDNTLMEVNEISDCELSTSPDFKPKFFYEGTLVLDTIRDSGLFNDILNSNNNNCCSCFMNINLNMFYFFFNKFSHCFINVSFSYL